MNAADGGSGVAIGFRVYGASIQDDEFGVFAGIGWEKAVRGELGFDSATEVLDVETVNFTWCVPLQRSTRRPQRNALAWRPDETI